MNTTSSFTGKVYPKTSGKVDRRRPLDVGRCSKNPRLSRKDGNIGLDAVVPRLNRQLTPPSTPNASRCTFVKKSHLAQLG